MSSLKLWVMMAMILALAGCTAALPKSHLVSHDPLLSRQGGVLLLVDACVQRDALGDANDYFVISEAKTGAQAVLSALHKYVEDSGIPVRAEIIPFVCGARHNTGSSSIKVAESVDSPVRDDYQPIGISVMIKNDPQYVNALSVVSTFAFEHAAVKREAPKVIDEESPGDKVPDSVGIKDFLSAAEVIKDRTQASSVLYLGVLGNSRTSGNMAAQYIGNVIIGSTVAVATAGLGTGYYLIFAPGFQFDGIVMEGALIDLESGQLTWSNAVKVGGDPIDPKAMANRGALDLLFRDIMFKPSLVQPSQSANF